MLLRELLHGGGYHQGLAGAGRHVDQRVASA
jgi:hypothetical protein